LLQSPTIPFGFPLSVENQFSTSLAINNTGTRSTSSAAINNSEKPSRYVNNHKNNGQTNDSHGKMQEQEKLYENWRSSSKNGVIRDGNASAASTQLFRPFVPFYQNQHTKKRNGGENVLPTKSSVNTNSSSLIASEREEEEECNDGATDTNADADASIDEKVEVEVEEEFSGLPRKRLICKYWELGHCKNTKAACNFAHGQRDLIRSTKQNKEKIQCHYFPNCKNGDTCEFLHLTTDK
jgi:hypothetical protein